MKYIIGIDLGGTFIKGGIVDKNGKLILQNKIPTEANKGNDRIIENISSLAFMLLKDALIDKSDVIGIGVGCPGMVDSEKGIVVCAENLEMFNFDFASRLNDKLGLKIKIANDANAATLGEVKFGAAKCYKNAIMLTLGTGVGGGMVCNGKLIEGNESAGAELGHMVIKMGGEPCSCGRRGCAEAYASATALIRDTVKMMKMLML